MVVVRKKKITITMKKKIEEKKSNKEINIQNNVGIETNLIEEEKKDNSNPNSKNNKK